MCGARKPRLSEKQANPHTHMKISAFPQCIQSRTIPLRHVKFKMPGKIKGERNKKDAAVLPKKKTDETAPKTDEEVRESQWLGKALRRQQTQTKLQELAAQRKPEKTAKNADSEVRAPDLMFLLSFTMCDIVFRMNSLSLIMSQKKWESSPLMLMTVQSMKSPQVFQCKF
jgi:hypothetical protein